MTAAPLLHLTFIALTFSLLGCTSTSTIKPFDETLQENYVPLEEEAWARKQGDKMHREIASKGLLYRHEHINDYISTLKDKLLSDQQLFEKAIHVYILRDPMPNAAALPNGIIYINSGLFSTLQTEGQLAAVLAHEIAHITEQHAVKQVISNKNTIIGAHIADLATGGFGLAYLPAIASMSSFSRTHETEADTEGLKRLQNSGFSPESMIEIFDRFKTMPDLKHIKNSIYSSHPSQDKRIDKLRTLIDSLPKTAHPTLVDNNDFTTLKALLMEDNVRMRLRARQYLMAQTILDEASEYYSSGSKIAYFTGEAYWGMAMHPVDAAVEKYWIETGEIQRRNKYVTAMNDEKKQNLLTARRHYLTAGTGDKPYLAALKRLGDINKELAAPTVAIEWYQQYLLAAPKAKDRLFVERMIQRLNSIQ